MVIILFCTIYHYNCGTNLKVLAYNIHTYHCRISLIGAKSDDTNSTVVQWRFFTVFSAIFYEL